MSFEKSFFVVFSRGGCWREGGVGLHRVKRVVLRAHRLGLESQLCCFLAVSPWVSYFTCFASIHLQNGVKVHTAKVPFFFSSKIAGAIIALVLTALALGEAVAWCSGVRQLWEGESHQRPLHPRRGQSFDPGDAEDASGITFGVPYSEEVG